MGKVYIKLNYEPLTFEVAYIKWNCGLNWWSYIWWWFLEAWRIKRLSPTFPSCITILKSPYNSPWSYCENVCSKLLFLRNPSILHNNMWLQWTLNTLWVEILVDFLCGFGSFQIITSCYQAQLWAISTCYIFFPIMHNGGREPIIKAIMRFWYFVLHNIWNLTTTICNYNCNIMLTLLFIHPSMKNFVDFYSCDEKHFNGYN